MDLRKGQGDHPYAYFTQYLKFIPLSILLLASLLFFYNFKLEDYFPIRTVQIYGIQHLDQDEVRELLLPLLSKGFFAIDVDLIRDRLQEKPWVGATIVRRNWPDRVVITVLERVPLAIWNNQGLLSENGELFEPNQATYVHDLPIFIGPVGKQIAMLDYFNKMNRLLTSLHAKISYLELTPYLTWKLKLDNGITLRLGQKDILTRLDHFVKVYPKIVGNRAKDVDYIDLRYANGFAVRWKVDTNA